MRDILDGIALARVAFLGAGLEPPTVMILGSHEEGMRFLSALRQQDHWMETLGSDKLGKEMLMSDRSRWMEVQVMGMAIRWPANRYAMPDGSFCHT